MSSFPNTSFHLKNEQYRLSLLENEEDTIGGDNNTIITNGIPTKADGVCGEKVSQYRRQDIFAPILMPKVPVPPSRPPLESRHPIRSLCHSMVSVFLTLTFYICLPVGAVLYIGLGFIPRLLIKLVFRWTDNGRFQLLPATRTCSSAGGNNNAVILVGRGECDIEKIRAYMYDVISAKDEITGVGKYGHLQKRVATKFGYLCFENRESSFDIKNHVKHFNIRNKHVAVDSDKIMAYLQSTYDDPFDNHLTNPQWEILLIPNYTMRKAESESYPKCGNEKKKFYALIIRFHNGIMDWNMLQELLVEFLGKSSGRVRSIFCPNSKYTSFGKIIKIMTACPLIGPQAFLRKVLNSWKPFANMAPFSEQHTKISFAATKPISAEAIEDIADRTQTGLASVLATSSRIAVRNLVLGQNMDFPDSITVTRAFNTMSSSLPGVDSFSTSFHKYRNAVERLHTSFHSVGKSDVGMRGEQAFNKMMMLLAGTFPCNLSAWMYKTLLKADVEVEICPGTDEPCKIFGGDVLEDFYAWSGVAGIDANFKITISSYCGRVRANVIGKLGTLSGGLTDAQIISNEFEVEYEHLASAVGLYPQQLYLSPVITESNEMYIT